MRIGIVVNGIDDLKPDQSTTDIAVRAVARGWSVALCPVAALGMDAEDRVFAWGPWLEEAGGAAATLAAARIAPRERILLGALDLVLVRTNPARDSRGALHGTALDLLRFVVEAGGRVLNAPDGLARAGSKLYLQHFPAQVRPRTLISRLPAELAAFVRDASGPVVLKPLAGTRGEDVFKVQGDTANLRQIIDVICRGGHAMAQDFVPEAVAGDTRLLLLDGRLIEVGGQIAAVRRVPSSADFRSNVHQGGRPARAPRTPLMDQIAAALGPRLRADGLFLVGADLIGDRVVELNVFSPGGFADAGRFGGVDFIAPLLDAIAARLES